MRFSRPGTSQASAAWWKLAIWNLNSFDSYHSIASVPLQRFPLEPTHPNDSVQVYLLVTMLRYLDATSQDIYECLPLE